MRYRRRKGIEQARDYPTAWCRWGRHEFLPLAHLKENLADGTMCFDCQMKIADNITEVIAMPEMSLAIRRREMQRRTVEQAKRKAESHVKTSAPDAPGMVYYIRINGHIKIGYTANLPQRSRNYPPDSELLAVEPGTPQTERERHQQFSRHLAKGREWFRESEEIAAHVAELQALNGVPDVLMHKYRTKSR